MLIRCDAVVVINEVVWVAHGGFGIFGFVVALRVHFVELRVDFIGGVRVADVVRQSVVD